MTAQQLKQPDRLITIHDLEYPRSISRRIKACLTLAGAAAAGVLALTATSPAANADTVELPVFPTTTGETIDSQSLGIAPFFGGEAYESNGSFTNLFGETIDTTASYYDGPPMEVDEYTFPGLDPTSVAIQISDPGGSYGVEGGGLDGSFEGSAFSGLLAPSDGFYYLYEDTPYFASGAAQETDNINESVIFDPSGDPLTGLSGVEFGIQYLDLPDAATPVDAINVLGSGGEILFSIPVTGDLLTSLF